MNSLAGALTFITKIQDDFCSSNSMEQITKIQEDLGCLCVHCRSRSVVPDMKLSAVSSGKCNTIASTFKQLRLRGAQI